MLEGRTVTNIEDEVFDSELLQDSDTLHGEGALLAALNKKRTGRMNDIARPSKPSRMRLFVPSCPAFGLFRADRVPVKLQLLCTVRHICCIQIENASLKRVY